MPKAGHLEAGHREAEHREAERVEPADLTDEEEARIQAGIAADPDSRISDTDLARMRPASEVLPPALYAALTRPRGRPKADVTKQPVKLRLDRATVAAFKATGEGWQTRMNDALGAAAKRLPKAAPPRKT